MGYLMEISVKFQKKCSKDKKDFSYAYDVLLPEARLIYCDQKCPISL